MALEVNGSTNYDEQKDVKSLIKNYNKYDYIFLLEAAIRVERRYNSELNTLTKLNNIIKLEEIKNIILEITSKFNNKDLIKFKEYITDYTNSNTIRSINFQDYEENKRLLNFSLNIIENEEIVKLKIRDAFIKFLYICYIELNNKIPKKLDKIKTEFSALILNQGSHFKNKDSEFYKWAINYMKDNPDYKSQNYSPINESDFKNTVEIIFDFLYYENRDRYENLKNKLSNAWNQKTHREKNKGKKSYYYVLSEKTKKELELLCFVNKCTEEQLLEKLISERYVKDCKLATGEEKYRLPPNS